jgi:hypothetical protein
MGWIIVAWHYYTVETETYSEPRFFWTGKAWSRFINESAIYRTPKKVDLALRGIPEPTQALRNSNWFKATRVRDLKVNSTSGSVVTARKR